MNEKKCNRCKEYKPLSMFSRDRSKKDGYRTICKKCTNEAQRKRYTPKPRDDSYSLTTIVENGVEIPAKKCRGCGEVKPLSEYYRHKTCVGGVLSRCKKCIGIKGKFTHSKLTYIEVNGKQVPAKDCGRCGKIKPLTDFTEIKSSRKGVGGRYSNCKECERLYRIELEKIGDRRERRLIRVRNYEKGYRERRKELYRKNISKMRNYSKIKDAKRLAYERNLRNDLTTSEYEEVLRIFDYKCALTGESNDLTLDHFIPLWTGHGGTYVGNVYPLSSSLNYSKQNSNPFEWVSRNDIKSIISKEKWDFLIEYLAEKNGLTRDEFEQYVNWCFSNRREPDEIKDCNKTSLELFMMERSKCQV